MKGGLEASGWRTSARDGLARLHSACDSRWHGVAGRRGQGAPQVSGMNGSEGEGTRARGGAAGQTRNGDDRAAFGPRFVRQWRMSASMATAAAAGVGRRCSDPASARRRSEAVLRCAALFHIATKFCAKQLMYFIIKLEYRN